eukprot:426808-Pelagomonas_calceolata.AAC.1
MQDGCVVAYTGTKCSPTEFNYTTSEKLSLGLAMLFALAMLWLCYLEGTVDCKLIRDMHRLIHLQTQLDLPRRQASILKGSLTWQICNPILCDPAASESVIRAGVMGLWRLSRHEGRSGRWGGLLESSCPHRLERARRE